MMLAAALLAGAAHAAPSLFKSEKVQLTSADIDSVAFSGLFQFGSLEPSKRDEKRCKVYPGDSDWPSEESWESLNALTDERLLRPRPQAAACYQGSEYDADACDEMTEN